MKIAKERKNRRGLGAALGLLIALLFLVAALPTNVVAENIPPVADIWVTPIPDNEGMATLVVGENAFIDCSEPHISYDPDGYLVRYTFDFGDGTYYTETPTNASDGSFDGYTMHSYTEAGYLTIACEIEDNDGATDSASTSLWVADSRPVAAYSYLPSEPEVDETIYFNGSSSYDPDNVAGEMGYMFNDIGAYIWTFGDGNSSVEEDPLTSHSYSGAGYYQVTLEVWDGFCLIDTEIKTVHVVASQPPNTPPVANFTYLPADPETDETITFNASSSYDTDGTIVNYTWDFGDSSPAAYGVEVAHSYDTADDYTVTLTVKDDDDATDQDAQVVPVTAADPDMFVNSIDFTKVIIKNKFKRLDITVEITDDSYDGVSGATVYGTLEGPDDIYQQYQDTTDGDGLVTFEYEELLPNGKPATLPSGTYTFTVTNVVKTDWNYNAEKDLDNPDSIMA